MRRRAHRVYVDRDRALRFLRNEGEKIVSIFDVQLEQRHAMPALLLEGATETVDYIATE